MHGSPRFIMEVMLTAGGQRTRVPAVVVSLAHLLPRPRVINWFVYQKNSGEFLQFGPDLPCHQLLCTALPLMFGHC